MREVHRGRIGSHMPPILLAVDKTYPKAHVVPPRPARGRQRRPLPCPSRLPPGGLRFRLRQGDSRCAAHGRPAGGIHPRVAGGARSRAARAGRRADRAARHRGARDSRAGPRPGRAGRVRQPRRRARRAGARRQGVRRAGQCRRDLSHLQGLDRLRPRRGHDQDRPALHGVHALQAGLAGQGRLVLPQVVPGAQPCRRAGALAPGLRRAGAHAARNRLREKQPVDARDSHGHPGRGHAVRRLLRAHRPLRRGAQLSGGARPQLHGRAPALRHGVDPADGQPGAPALAAGQCGRGDLAQRADLARLLLPDPDALSPRAHGRRVEELPPRVRQDPVAPRQARRPAVRGLVRRPHRLPAGGRGHAADQPERLHAQPPAHGGRELFVQGPGAGLAARRGLLRAAPERLRAGVEQRRLAVGQLQRLRRAALFPHLQPGDAERALRPRRQVHPPLPAAAGGAVERGHPRAVERHAGGAGGGGHQARRELPQAGGRPHRGAREDAAALRGGASEGAAK